MLVRSKTVLIKITINEVNSCDFGMKTIVCDDVKKI